MKKSIIILSIFFLVTACKGKKYLKSFVKYDETIVVKQQQNHQNSRMKFKLFQSKVLDMNEVYKPFNEELATFTEQDFQTLKPLILEQDIPSLQKSVKDGKLSYEKLTLFYLYRIRKFESDSTLSLNSIIALNPNVLKEAKEKDKQKKDVSKFSIYGIPILLKDNINTKEMATTAGAIALQRNFTKNNAFIVEKLIENGALILGKVNLSEWAYFFCSGCPLGYSAIGGQTLNPYGRGEFETGGSSAGSGVTVAANFAVAAVGTETSGSITSPSSLNSVVGLKPTIGVLSRTGIVPISSTLDTPGPMTKNVIDNAILMNAMRGFDKNDAASMKLDGFITLLNIDMKHDLPTYLANNADKLLDIKNVKSVVEFNKKDTLLRAPYGQQLFEGIVKDTTTLEQLEVIKANLKSEGEKFLASLTSQNLDVILSINNYHSGVAAVAKHPTLTVPMGYKKSGEPISLTFIGVPFSERKLLEIGFAFEQLTKARKTPKNYQ